MVGGGGGGKGLYRITNKSKKTINSRSRYLFSFEAFLKGRDSWPHLALVHETTTMLSYNRRGVGNGQREKLRARKEKCISRAWERTTWQEKNKTNTNCFAADLDSIKRMSNNHSCKTSSKTSYVVLECMIHHNAQNTILQPKNAAATPKQARSKQVGFPYRFPALSRSPNPKSSVSLNEWKFVKP